MVNAQCGVQSILLDSSASWQNTKVNRKADLFENQSQTFKSKLVEATILFDRMKS
jgi:hypothetical protein